MVVIDASIYDSDLYAFAKDAEVVQLANSGGVVSGIVQGRGATSQLLGVDGVELNALVEPDLYNVGQGSETVGVELPRLNTDSREDIAVEGPDDFDAGGVGNFDLAPPESSLD